MHGETSPISTKREYSQFHEQWFAREAGCLESRCPFLHDKKACIQDRERVLSNRRTTLGRPTMRDISLREKRQLAEYREKSQKEDTSVPGDSDALTLWDAVSDDELDPEVDRIFKGRMNIRKICSNPECLSVKVKRKAREAGEGDENTKMMVCSRCKVTNYCSVSAFRKQYFDFQSLFLSYIYTICRRNARLQIGSDTRKNRVSPLKNSWRMTICGTYLGREKAPDTSVSILRNRFEHGRT